MTEDKSQKTVLWVVAVIVATIVSVIALNEYFISLKQGSVYDVVQKTQPITLPEIRADEEEILNSYQLVDSTTGQYRIPIGLAIELAVTEAQQVSEDR